MPLYPNEMVPLQIDLAIGLARYLLAPGRRRFTHGPTVSVSGYSDRLGVSGCEVVDGSPPCPSSDAGECAWGCGRNVAFSVGDPFEWMVDDSRIAPEWLVRPREVHGDLARWVGKSGYPSTGYTPVSMAVAG